MYKTTWFLGLVHGLGVVEKAERIGKPQNGVKLEDYREEEAEFRLWIKVTDGISDLKVGENLSVNGVCLTVLGVEENTFTVNLWSQTVQKTNLPDLKPGDRVNLERNRQKRD